MSQEGNTASDSSTRRLTWDTHLKIVHSGPRFPDVPLAVRSQKLPCTSKTDTSAYPWMRLKDRILTSSRPYSPATETLALSPQRK